MNNLKNAPTHHKLGNRIFHCAALLMVLGFTTHAMANPIQTENSLAGDPNWTFPFSHVPADPHDLEGYTDKISVQKGGVPSIPGSGAITFYTNVNATKDATYTLTVYRLGWYGGVGARRMTTPVVLKSAIRSIPAPNAFGMVDAGWENSPSCATSISNPCDWKYALTVPWSWVSGVYVATIVGNTTQTGRYIPFVVKDDTSTAPYLFQTSDTTWHAYNNWGGKSLYTYNSIDNTPARKVSYNRPFPDSYGLGTFASWELKMLRFLEQEGYDVTYQSNIDTHSFGEWQLARKHKVFLSVGHDEYWTRTMRDNVQNSSLRGMSLGFFGANAAYWQIRLESSSTSVPNRTIVAYKDEGLINNDPLANDSDNSNNIYVTRQWRDPKYWDRPENAMIGVMYANDPVDADIVVQTTPPSGASQAVVNLYSRVFANTGLNNGDHLPHLLGYEVDSIVANGKAPTNLLTLADSPYTIPAKSTSGYSQMTLYTQPCTLSSSSFPCASSQATVFATGSMHWNYGLDNFLQPTGNEYANPAAKQITRNVLGLMAGN